MAKELERDLGLFAVVTISMGAMIGSGIFVLPGIATTMAGPAVILAYLLAGLIVLPAAISKAEMATAMPEAGGTYLYIDRSMGPLAGSIAGIGTWFSLSFKSAFALVGLGAYLLLFATVDPILVKVLALAIAGGLVLVNVLGAKQTGRLQATIVTIVMAALVFIVANGMTQVQAPNFDPFFPTGLGGLLAATGFVFVSYAGVTKIASVAEEVEDPGRNIPLGMLLSVTVMMVVYTLIVFVVVGVSPAGALGKTLTPMADAAARFLGPIGIAVVVTIAVLALTSMANAGLLSSSRYPFAMGRDELAPEMMTAISDRFRTPINAIVLTGLLMMGLIAFVDVINLAKLASAFKILIFVLVNIGLIAFREAELDWYDPEFTSPAYPWIQFAGIGGGLVLLTQMGLIPMVGAVGIVVAGTAWYYLFAGGDVEREGAGVDALRRSAGRRSLAEAEQMIAGPPGRRILIPLPDEVDPAREDPLLRVAAGLVGTEGRIEVAEFEEVPFQVSLGAATELGTEEDAAFEAHTAEVAEELGVEVEAGEIVSHDTRRALINHIEREGIDLLVVDAAYLERTMDIDAAWLMDRVPCDVVFVRNRGLGDVEEIAVVSDGGSYDPVKVSLANTFALRHGASLRFVQILEPKASDAQVDSIEAYHDDLTELCDVPVESIVVRSDDRLHAVLQSTDGTQLLVLSGEPGGWSPTSTFGEFQEKTAEMVDVTTLLVHPYEPRHQSFLRSLVERVLYG